MRTHGTVVKWNDERGFGFIAAALGSEEIFVHVSAFPRDGQRPQVGEIVSFEIQSGADGKRKAMRIRRPGAPAPARKRQRESNARPSSFLGAVATFAILVAVCGWAYSRWAPPSSVTTEALAPMPLARPLATGESFTCDGRTQCPQMRSCAEATYFQKNCPGVQMDGDGDGQPCEQQWCN